MSRSSEQKSLRLRRLRAASKEGGRLQLLGTGLAVELTALAADLFRLRVRRGGPRAAAPSWAVAKSHWPPVEAVTNANQRTASLATAAGRFVMDLHTGAWSVEGAGGAVAFSAAGGSTGFEGGKPHLDLGLADGEHVFGLGETTGQFDRRGLVREFWNIDVLGHAPAIHPGLKSLYVSIPFALLLRHGRAAGLFWDNPARQVWDIGQTRFDRWRLAADSGEMDLYLFINPSVEAVLGRYTELTGRIPLPPLWGLGFQQCRYSYQSRRRLEQVAREFRRRKLPCDVLYLDIHHMDGYRVFTFGKTFPRPASMIRRLAQSGFKVVTIVDPGVKDHEGFEVLRRGVRRNAFVKAADGGADYVGEVWPGAARFPDFLNAAARSWWGEEQSALSDLGVAGFWNDMNEPANFARPDKTLPPDALHRTDHGRRRHAAVHNLYGMQMARASYEGALSHTPNRRPFVVTRAGYAGVQRHAVVWTGDNSSNWDQLNDAVQMLLNLSISGVPFCGGDTGGFLDNTTPELFARWFEFAAFTPFFRNHTNLGTIDQEPWAFGPKVEKICRRHLNLRYRLLPYLYGLFAAARATGAPIMRPLFWHYQRDPVAVACGDQFLLGRDLLVAPVLRQGAVARSVYLPAGTWFDYATGQRFQGGRHTVAEAPLERIPLFARAGGILPMMPPRQFVDGRRLQDVELHVWAEGEGGLDWYEDDGISCAYENGTFHRRTLAVTAGTGSLSLRMATPTGSLPSRVRRWRLCLHGIGDDARLFLDGQPLAGGFHTARGELRARIPNRAEEFTITVRSAGARRAS